MFEVAHQIGLLPLLGCVLARSRERAHWWLAAALSVSWLADTVAHWYDPWLMGLVYSVLQVAIVGLVFLDRDDALRLLGVLTLSGLVAAWWQGNMTLLITVAWLSVVGIVWDRPQLGLLRDSLVVYFGFGLVAWLAFVAAPAYPSWFMYQFTRLAGLVLFCGAVWKPQPALKLA